MISSFIPFAGVGDKYQLFMEIGRTDGLDLCALLNSFVVDWATRQKHGGTDLSYFTTRQIAVQPLHHDNDALARLHHVIRPSERTTELLATAWDLGAAWRRTPFKWDARRRSQLLLELDAYFFHVYGIPGEDVRYIMDAFPIVRRKEEAEFGEYRTKRLILEIYDRMADAIASGEPYTTILDPPPADPSLCHDPSTRPDWADLYLPQEA